MNDVRGVATGWTGVDTSTPLFFLEDVSGIESLWSVLISFRLYPQTLPRLGRGHEVALLWARLVLGWVTVFGRVYHLGM